MATPLRPRPASRSNFHIAIICALLEERLAIEALMTRHFKSEGHTYGIADGDENSYTLGEFGGKAVVLVAPRDMGITNTRDLAHGMRNSFKNISYAFVVGITGGAPFTYDERKNEWQQSDIHLGDVIVSTHVIDSGFGKEHDNFFETRSEIQHVLPRAPAWVANFVNLVKEGVTLDRVIRLISMCILVLIGIMFTPPIIVTSTMNQRLALFVRDVLTGMGMFALRRAKRLVRNWGVDLYTATLYVRRRYISARTHPETR
ncbi:hypothetical protein LTR49_027007 [Elasticomyces elasticus]|nr:hypothetical protein LTR49_027007 [Elasticomyces elasticus]